MCIVFSLIKKTKGKRYLQLVYGYIEDAYLESRWMNLSHLLMLPWVSAIQKLFCFQTVLVLIWSVINKVVCFVNTYILTLRLRSFG